MKCFIMFAVLCAVLLATIAATPLAGHKQQLKQLRPVAAATKMQRRSWLPFKQSKWALRRSSDDAACDPAVQTVAADADAVELEPLSVDAAADLVEQPEDAGVTVEAAAAPAAPAAVSDDSTAAPAAADEPIAPATPTAAPSFPPHTFFPMNFGSMSGGSVAVANSFSTGKGSAYSHAIAHGTKKTSA